MTHRRSSCRMPMYRSKRPFPMTKLSSTSCFLIPPTRSEEYSGKSTELEFLSFARFLSEYSLTPTFLSSFSPSSSVCFFSICLAFFFQNTSHSFLLKMLFSCILFSCILNFGFIAAIIRAILDLKIHQIRPRAFTKPIK